MDFKPYRQYFARYLRILHLMDAAGVNYSLKNDHHTHDPDHFPEATAGRRSMTFRPPMDARPRVTPP